MSRSRFPATPVATPYPYKPEGTGFAIESCINRFCKVDFQSSRKYSFYIFLGFDVKTITVRVTVEGTPGWFLSDNFY